MLMMVRALLVLTMVRALLACVLTCMQSSIIWHISGRIGKLEQQLICGGKTFDKGGTTLPWPNSKAETPEQEATNEKPQLPNMYEKFWV